jgi:hypothetical protein
VKLKSTSQLLCDQIGAEFDFFIGASGYERRATHAFSKLKMGRVPQKIIFGFTDRKTIDREDNDRIFRREGCNLDEFSGSDGTSVFNRISGILRESSHHEIRLFVDYSCMTRTWYAAILRAILSSHKSKVTCCFSYSPAVFEEPHQAAPNEEVGPLLGFCSLESTDKPTALVIGLGYEAERATGLIEYVDPVKSFVFLTDPALDERYVQSVLNNNSDLLSSLSPEQVFRHPLHDLQYTSLVLNSLYLGLRETHRVIFAPLGVKPFCLLCLLISAHNGDVDVWRVTSGVKSQPQARIPLGPLLALEAVFESS